MVANSRTTLPVVGSIVAYLVIAYSFAALQCWVAV
jgi:hypothetical protein